MTPKLSDEMRQAMQEHPGAAVKVVDEATKATVWLVSDEAYQRVRPLIDPDDELNIEETYAAQEEVAREAGWDDPAMDVYNDHPSMNEPPA